MQMRRVNEETGDQEKLECWIVLQENKTGAEDAGQDGHETDGNRGEAQVRRLETGRSSVGAGAGAGGATAGGAGGAGAGAGTGARTGGSGARGLSAGVLATLAAEALALTSTAGQVLHGGGGNSGQGVTINVPVRGILGGTAAGTTGAVVLTVASGVVGLLEGGLQGIVVGQVRHGIAADLDQAIVAGLLGVLVDEATRVDTGHLGGVQSADLLKLTGVGVAAVLGKEERDTVAGEVLDLLIPAGDLERGGVTPGVVVEGEEVTALVVATAVHVLGHLQTVGIDIGSGVTDRDLAQLVAREERTDVTSDSLDVGSSLGGGAIVDHLVTGEEGQGVVVLGERLDGGEDVLKVDVVVRRLGLGTVEGVLGGVDIQDQVDTGLSQGVHALIMVLGVVDRVHTDGVETEVLELLDVALAAIGISDGIGELGGATGLVVNTTDVETVVALEKGIALDGDGGDLAVTLLGEGGSTENGGGAQSEGSCEGGDGGLHNVGL